MLIHKERMTETASSGTWTHNTVRFFGGRCQQVYCRPATPTTTYDIQIQDEDDDIVFERYGVEGLLNETVGFPLRGTYTVTVSSASADEEFVCFLGVREF